MYIKVYHGWTDKKYGRKDVIKS